MYLSSRKNVLQLKFPAFQLRVDMLKVYKTAMFDVSTSDSILLRRNGVYRVHSDTGQKDTLDLDPLHLFTKDAKLSY